MKKKIDLTTNNYDSLTALEQAVSSVLATPARRDTTAANAIVPPRDEALEALQKNISSTLGGRSRKRPDLSNSAVVVTEFDDSLDSLIRQNSAPTPAVQKDSRSSPESQPVVPSAPFGTSTAGSLQKVEAVPRMDRGWFSRQRDRRDEFKASSSSSSSSTTPSAFFGVNRPAPAKVAWNEQQNTSVNLPPT